MVAVLGLEVGISILVVWSPWMCPFNVRTFLLLLLVCWVFINEIFGNLRVRTCRKIVEKL